MATTLPSDTATPDVVHKPYVPDDVTMPEFTARAVLTGAVLGIIFGASSLYLVLKIGITVSASIPVAVLAITLFRALGMKLTILENNIVQTAGSAGESIAFGVGVTMPALMLIGFDMTLTRVMFVSLLGGTLGILMMIPLRRAFIVKLSPKDPKDPKSGELLYPEGTACAEVLKSGEAGGTSGGIVFFGLGLAFVHKFICEGVNLLKATVDLPLSFFNRAAVLSGDMASELLGVGYILGIRTAAVMMAGAVLGYLVIIPTIDIFGTSAATPLPPAKVPIGQFPADDVVNEIRKNYLLFIGAGCVAAAGIISMFKTLPMIIGSFGSSLGSLRGAGGGPVAGKRRTEDDLPMSVVLLGSLALVAVLAVYLSTEVGWSAAVAGGALVVLFGFLFVTVSSRLTGEVGSTSNPISGMTVATLTMTCLIFLGLGWTSPTERVLALTIGAVVCIASSNGGTTSQDLKTGYLVGGTPRLQQYAILIGALTSALVIGGTLLAFNKAGTVYSTDPKNLPKADFRVPADELEKLPAEAHEGTTYHVWRPSEDQVKDGVAEPGRYLVDGAGKPVILDDPAVVPRLTKNDQGEKVTLKFAAPKTAVIGIIINGVLKQDLKWDFIILGALIAVTLELCGISSLAFAVGVYVPISVSAPIFVGGLVRWGVDRYMARRRGAAAGAVDEVEAIKETETSPGVLLASGYIAGGSLGGVLIAFLNFAPDFLEKINLAKLPQVEALNTWQGPVASWGQHLPMKPADYVSLAAFGLLAVVAAWLGTRRSTRPPADDPTRPAERLKE
jgi:putative OPT family oligopeptide transporter